MRRIDIRQSIHNARLKEKEDLAEEEPHGYGTLEPGSKKPHPNCFEPPSTKL